MKLINCKDIEKKLPLSNFDDFVDENYENNNIIYISFFDRWLTRDDIEIKKTPTYYLDEHADKSFYEKYYEFENKLIQVFIYLFKRNKLYGFLPINSRKRTPIFTFINEDDLSSTIKVFLRLEHGLCLYFLEEDILFNLNEDLTIQVFNKNLSEEVIDLIISLNLHVLRKRDAL
jgi:hypothetical protein